MSQAREKQKRRVKLWLLLGLVLCSFAGYYTWREGGRFVPRPLTAGERLLVERALELGEALEVPVVEPLRKALAEGKIVAMDEPTFERREERITMGYTDEDGLIMLNPRICFASHHTLASQRPHLDDLVKTLSTLVHEYQHREYNAPESQAYEVEWQFIKSSLQKAAQPELHRALKAWEAEMSERVRLYVGSTRWERLKEGVSSP